MATLSNSIPVSQKLFSATRRHYPTTKHDLPIRIKCSASRRDDDLQQHKEDISQFKELRSVACGVLAVWTVTSASPVIGANPLLMQCRLFSQGHAVKGTLLVNKKLKPGTIQIGPSMVKVETDATMTVDQTFDSLEIVAISHRPRRSYLSKYLIALLSHGGVPRSFFLDLLTSVLEETDAVFTNKRAAFKVALNYEDFGDAGGAVRMMLAGIPLNEPYLQKRLSELATTKRSLLKEGKLPITESFYLMGTADPTDSLTGNKVCVILDNGHMSGNVLVYRNPGLHFGDIHVLEAVYVKKLEDTIGNAKYGIFFPAKGQRSVASKIANGDFDGDMYWVSRNPQLLEYFRASKPWTRTCPSQPAVNKKPNEFSDEQLEHELFQLFLGTMKPSQFGQTWKHVAELTWKRD